MRRSLICKWVYPRIWIKFSLNLIRLLQFVSSMEIRIMSLGLFSLYFVRFGTSVIVSAFLSGGWFPAKRIRQLTGSPRIAIEECVRKSGFPNPHPLQFISCPLIASPAHTDFFCGCLVIKVSDTAMLVVFFIWPSAPCLTVLQFPPYMVLQLAVDLILYSFWLLNEEVSLIK